jgi:branched-chain amino acid transport system permease protein
LLGELIFIGVRGIGLGALFALVAMGFNIVHRSSHVLNFAQGNILVLGGLGAFLFYTDGTGAAPWLLALLGVTALLGLLVSAQGWLTLLPLRYSNEQDSWLITTMAASVIIEAGLLLTQGPFVRSTQSPFPSVTVYGMRTPAPYLLSIALMIAWYLALRWFLSRTVTGLAISALSQDFDAARAAGLRVRRLQVLAFAISGLILGSAGFVAAPVITIAPAAGLQYVVNGFIAAVIGGMGSNTGALLGGPIVGVISMFATYQVGGEFQGTILLLVMVAVLMVRPQGLFGNAAARRV